MNQLKIYYQEKLRRSNPFAMSFELFSMNWMINFKEGGEGEKSMLEKIRCECSKGDMKNLNNTNEIHLS